MNAWPNRKRKALMYEEKVPGSLITVTGGCWTEAELASEHRLPDITLNLKNLRTTHRLTVELENESRIRLRFDIQMELRAWRAFIRIFADCDPTIVKHTSLALRSGEIQRDCHFR